MHFVTQLKRNVSFREGAKRRGRKSPGVLEDRVIELEGVAGQFRKICFADETCGEAYEFLTNAHESPAATVAALYKERPQVELFSSGSSST